jgi:hypothetical protein
MTAFTANRATEYFERLIAEKGVSLDDPITSLEPRGIIATYQLSWELIAQFNEDMQEQFIAKCTEIDFVNQDVFHFIDYFTGEIMKDTCGDFVS